MNNAREINKNHDRYWAAGAIPLQEFISDLMCAGKSWTLNKWTTRAYKCKTL